MRAPAGRLRSPRPPATSLIRASQPGLASATPSADRAAWRLDTVACEPSRDRDRGSAIATPAVRLPHGGGRRPGRADGHSRHLRRRARCCSARPMHRPAQGRRRTVAAGPARPAWTSWTRTRLRGRPDRGGRPGHAWLPASRRPLPAPATADAGTLLRRASPVAHGARRSGRRRPAGASDVRWRAMAYLDHAATTPMLPEAVEAYVAAAAATSATPRRCTRPGRQARRRVEEARERVAAALGARPSEVIFTGGGTESDNLAVKGIYWARRAADPRPQPGAGQRGRAPRRARRGRTGSAAPRAPRSPGCPSTRSAGCPPDALREELDRARRRGRRGHRHVGQQRGRHGPAGRRAGRASPPSTACRSTPTRSRRSGSCRSTSPRSGAAALTVTGHKLGGPVGVGALLLGRDVDCTPLLHGGGQERDVRSGTLDVAGDRRVRGRRRDRGQGPGRSSPPGSARCATSWSARVRAAVPDAVLNGDPGDRLPGNAHFSFPGCEGDALLLLLDAPGIACSTGSACSAGVAQPSHVLLAMGADEHRPAVDPAVHPRPHLDRGRRRRARSPRCRRAVGAGPPGRARRSTRGARASRLPLRRVSDAGAGRHVRRRRLGGRGRPGGRRRARRHRRAPRAGPQPADATDRAPAAAARSRTPATPAGPPTCSASRSTSGTWPSEFHASVVDDFVAEYAAGRTPNPCLRCNEKIKFAAVLDRALALGFDAVVTGHHARLGPDGLLRRSVDPAKDQSYVLAVLTRDQLDRVDVPARRLDQGRGAGGGRRARTRRGRQAGLARHLLHRRRRHPRLPAPSGSARRPGDIVDAATRRGARRARRRLRLHGRPAQGART